MRSLLMVEERREAGFGRLLWLSWRAQAPMLAVALGFLAAVMVLAWREPAMRVLGIAALPGLVISLLVILLVVLAAMLAIGMAIAERPRHPIARLAARLAAFLGSALVMALGLPALLGLMVFIYAFTVFKANIPLLQPFAWDRRLDALDAALHFGRRPWQWLQPVLGHWPVTLAVNVAYNLWYVVMVGVWLQFAFRTAPGLARTRFLLAFMLLWMVGGSLGGLAFSSAGPCYFGAGHLGLSPDPYAALTAYLAEVDARVPLWAVGIQRELWQLHLDGSPEGSISAMPSMHNGSVLLFALAAGGWPRWIRRLMWVFVAVVFVGSVHLAWHYAVDGYAAWLLALGAWMLALPLARRCEARPSAGRFAALFAESPASL